jgi:hypothetical protein
VDAIERLTRFTAALSDEASRRGLAIVTDVLLTDAIGRSDVPTAVVSNPANGRTFHYFDEDPLLCYIELDVDRTAYCGEFRPEYIEGEGLSWILAMLSDDLESGKRFTLFGERWIGTERAMRLYRAGAV